MRDQLIAQALETVGVLSTRQVQTLCFSLVDDAACKRRLLKLSERKLIKRLARRHVSEPYLYYHQKPPAPSLLEHNLGVSEIFVRVSRAVSELGWNLATWLSPKQLQPLLSARTKLAPDAYFQLQRSLQGQLKSAGFFVEFEHSVQRDAVLSYKLTRYADLFHSGLFNELFGIPAMRVLVIYDAGFAMPAKKRLMRGKAIAETTGVKFARFSTMDSVCSVSPNGFLLSQLWQKPLAPNPVALYSLEDAEGIS